MEIKLIAFGIAKDILQTKHLKLEVREQITVADLKAKLCQLYPDFEKLRSLSLAVNEEYQADDFVINATDEVVIIPPVSGG